MSTAEPSAARERAPAAPDSGPWIGAPGELEAHRRFWLGTRAPAADAIRIRVPDACVDELDRVLGRAAGDARALAALVDEPFAPALATELPALAELGREVREAILRAPGAALVDRFPAERYDDAGNLALAGLFAPRILPLLHQNAKGETLYEVTDEKPIGPTRKSKTNEAQPMHTDGGWYDPPARAIGLYCVRSAATGGHSLIGSLVAAIDRLRRDGEAGHVAALEAPMPWHRQNEHAPGESATASLPALERADGTYVARWYRAYVRQGFEALGEPMPDGLGRALDALERALDEMPKIRFLAEAGHWQALDNYACVHSREAFEDDASAGPRRLVRVWHRAQGAAPTGV